MFRYRLTFAVILVAFAVALMGCSDDQIVNPGDQVNPDEAALTAMMDDAVGFQHDVVSHTVPDTTAAPGTAKYFWWREYTTTDRQYDFTMTPPDSVIPNALADVTITTTFSGTLHIVHRDVASVYTHTTKPLVDVFTQSVQFEQLFSETSTNRGWIIKSLTHPIGGSSPATVDIQNVVLTPATSAAQSYYGSTFGDMYLTTDRPMFQLDETINVMVQSGSGLNEAYRHDFYSGGSTMQALVNQEFGFYSDVWTTPASLSSAEASRMLVVDVIADGVIDGSADYNALIWGITYGVDLGGAPQ